MAFVTGSQRQILSCKGQQRIGEEARAHGADSHSADASDYSMGLCRYRAARAPGLPPCAPLGRLEKSGRREPA